MRKLALLPFAVLIALAPALRADAYYQIATDTNAPPISSEVPPTAPSTDALTTETPATPNSALSNEGQPTSPVEETTTPTPPVSQELHSEAASPDKVDSDAVRVSAQDSAHVSWLPAFFGGSIVLLAFAAIAGILLYFLPTLIARSRNHRNTIMIGFINLFTGWTVIGWVGCLVWAALNPVVTNTAQSSETSGVTL